MLFSDTDSPVLATVDSQFCPTVRFMSDWSYFVLFICVVGVGAGVVFGNCAGDVSVTVCGPFTKGEMERGEKSIVIREQYRWYD